MNNSDCLAVSRRAFLNPGDWMFHCHILEHEDHEMMRQFEVLAPPGDIPAVSTWGACVILLLLLSAGTIIVRIRVPL